MLNLPELDGILDLWGACWDPDERRTLEVALLRTLGDPTQPRAVAKAALTACHVLGTPRLLLALADAAEADHFSDEERREVERRAQPLQQLVQEAALLRGNLAALEALCRQAPSPSGDALLNLVDVRDLIALARRPNTDAEVRAEVTRRLCKRGRHQRHRAREAAVPVPLDHEYAEYALELELEAS